VDRDRNVFQPLRCRHDIPLLREAGFVIAHMEQVDQDNDDGRFLWTVARRAAPVSSTG
jgi:hypothetical protein